MNDELFNFAKRYAEAWCSQDPEKVAAFYAKSGWISVNGGPATPIAEVARDFPDMAVTSDSLESRPDGTAFHWTFTGTNTGPGGTGNRVRINGYELWKIDNGAGGSRATWTGKPERVDEQGDESINDGLIAELKGNFDTAEYERQLQENKRIDDSSKPRLHLRHEI